MSLDVCNRHPHKLSHGVINSVYPKIIRMRTEPQSTRDLHVGRPGHGGEDVTQP